MVVAGAVAGAAIALLAMAGVASYLAYVNENRADRWRDRAATLERNASALNDLLVARTAALNRRIRELNVLAAKVRRAEEALSRSEGDVEALEERQRQLANEKAQIEDERAALVARQAALEDVAARYVGCKQKLVTLVDSIAGGAAAAQAIADDAFATCDGADDALRSYLATYGR